MIKTADRLITYQNETLTIGQWAERYGIEVKQVASRLNQGWLPIRAITQPVAKRKANHNAGWGFIGQSEAAPKPKPKTITITHNGQERTISEWAKITGLKKVTIAKRHRNGWPVDAILSTTDHRAANSQLHTQPASQHRTSDHAPGVVSDFDTSLGTGVGTDAQDTPEIGFPHRKGASQ
jgi:hypothetical protein